MEEVVGRSFPFQDLSVDNEFPDDDELPAHITAGGFGRLRLPNLFGKKDKCSPARFNTWFVVHTKDQPKGRYKGCVPGAKERWCVNWISAPCPGRLLDPNHRLSRNHLPWNPSRCRKWKSRNHFVQTIVTRWQPEPVPESAVMDHYHASPGLPLPVPAPGHPRPPPAGVTTQLTRLYKVPERLRIAMIEELLFLEDVLDDERHRQCFGQEHDTAG
ncbi:hypothetical protein QBC39DRAFT_334774 [Podospora conica]|nr:hypothetical protein QBC39DRAFT_334774 [Schizothecium conicum]